MLDVMVDLSVSIIIDVNIDSYLFEMKEKVIILKKQAVLIKSLTNTLILKLKLLILIVHQNLYKFLKSLFCWCYFSIC